MITSIPAKFRVFFWDIDFDTLDPSKKPMYVINRLLEKGNEAAYRWVIASFPQNLIKKTIMTQHDFSLKNASFWATVYDIPLNELVCFQQPYLQIRRQHWPY